MRTERLNCFIKLTKLTNQLTKLQRVIFRNEYFVCVIYIVY